MELEIEDVVTTTEPDDEPQSPPPTPPVDIEKVSRNIVSDVLRSLQTAPTQQRQSELHTAVQEMLGENIPEKAIKHMLRLIEADRVDNQRFQAQQNAARGHDSFLKALWGEAEAAVLAFEGDVAGVEYAVGKLCKDVSDIFESNPEFAAARDAMRGGNIPAKKWFAKAADMVIDKYCQKMGLTKSRAPVDLRGSKPKPSEKEFDPSGLEPGERRLYLAVKSSSGDEKLAREAVENTRKLSRGK